jgi:hypothetical protein
MTQTTASAILPTPLMSSNISPNNSNKTMIDGVSPTSSGRSMTVTINNENKVMSSSSSGSFSNSSSRRNTPVKSSPSSSIVSSNVSVMSQNSQPKSSQKQQQPASGNSKQSPSKNYNNMGQQQQQSASRIQANNGKLRMSDLTNVNQQILFTLSPQSNKNDSKKTTTPSSLNKNNSRNSPPHKFRTSNSTYSMSGWPQSPTKQETSSTQMTTPTASGSHKKSTSTNAMSLCMQQKQQQSSPVNNYQRNMVPMRHNNNTAGQMMSLNNTPNSTSLNNSSSHSPTQKELGADMGVPNPFGGSKYQDPPPADNLPLPPMQWTVAATSSSCSSTSSSGSITPTTSRSPTVEMTRTCLNAAVAASTSSCLFELAAEAALIKVAAAADKFSNFNSKSTENGSSDFNRIFFNSAPSNTRASSLHTQLIGAGSNPVSCHA